MLSILSHVKYSDDKYKRITGENNKLSDIILAPNGCVLSHSIINIYLWIIGFMIKIGADSIHKQWFKYYWYYCYKIKDQ